MHLDKLRGCLEHSLNSEPLEGLIRDLSGLFDQGIVRRFEANRDGLFRGD
jgi:hypothetical protein